MTRTIIAAIAALTIVQSVGLARLAAAQAQPWNQEVATATAGELEDAVSGLRDVVRGNPTINTGPNRPVIYQIIDNLRMIEASSTSLHASLKRGSGMEETLPTYKRLQQLVRETEVLSEKVDISGITKPKLDKAQDLLKKLEVYYPAEPQVPT